MFERIFVPIAREGWPFIGIFAVASVILAIVAEPLGWIGAVLTLWCVYFFRDPARVTPQREGLIVSPADGVVEMIADVAPPAELALGREPRTRVSVFMNVFDCHVNRIPIAGEIKRLIYVPGRFVNAALDKASEENERQLVELETSSGKSIIFVQIAGLVARRIVCRLGEAQTVGTGERFGLIRFGSRVDVYLPAGVEPLVAVGQRCVSAETVIADLASNEPARQGAVQ
jgi:phosphatidylserine decarboxylase